jgi:Acyl-CoA carboxylase epsilon subunit
MHTEPFLRVIRGRPDAAELAALTAVLTALAHVPGDPAPPRRPVTAGWRRPERVRGLCNARSWYRAGRG